MKKIAHTFYHAALYLRLSDKKLNEERGESESIANQEALLRSYLESFKDIEICRVFKDDGFSGVNFDRPGFQSMMQMIYDNEIDCVVVKDLSRLGRNHTETGKYVTRIFPAFGVRFIAVNDNIDSSNYNPDTNNFIIPFKDLLNDSYSRDISMKIRSALAVKTSAGDFGGGFHVYGYEIDPENKNHYAVDREAANVVRMIFKWTFDGMGSSQIVKRLEMMHIPAPIEHKKRKRLGPGYVTRNGSWNIYQIYRILRNDVYTGTLRLGKTTTPNYKVKKRICKPEEDQHVFVNNHEPIISKNEFELMQDILSRDSRVAQKRPGENQAKVYPLVGYVFCADCGGNMVVKSTVSKGKIYRYYICGENKRESSFCSKHPIPYEKLTGIVRKAINAHFDILVENPETCGKTDAGYESAVEGESLQIRIGRILEEKQKIANLAGNLKNDLKEGILTMDEYEELHNNYRERIIEMKKDALMLENERARIALNGEYGMKLPGIKPEDDGNDSLTRRNVAALIDRIEVKDCDHIRIRFRFENEYKRYPFRREKKGYAKDR